MTERLTDLATLEELRQRAETVRNAQADARVAIDARDAAIAAALVAGVSPTAMARHMGLDRQLVYRIAK
jgi:hypothetical protein